MVFGIRSKAVLVLALLYLFLKNLSLLCSFLVSDLAVAASVAVAQITGCRFPGACKWILNPHLLKLLGLRTQVLSSVSLILSHLFFLFLSVFVLSSTDITFRFFMICVGMLSMAAPSVGLGLGLGSGIGSGKSAFTFLQLQELEHQALIFKYMVAGVPVPFHLVLPIWKSVVSSAGGIYKHYPSCELQLRSLLFFLPLNYCLWFVFPSVLLFLCDLSVYPFICFCFHLGYLFLFFFFSLFVWLEHLGFFFKLS